MMHRKDTGLESNLQSFKFPEPRIVPDTQQALEKYLVNEILALPSPTV